ncbi:FxLYD domain-containing protein [Asanoa sp. NPDC049573]|uniref:FxLYD domain-containing protein n=1 Tax=Asanoa sp. NPDC049573 TaxID=3155396 RepID=UPI00343211F3
MPPSPRPAKQNFWTTWPGAATLAVILALLAVSVWSGARESRARTAKMLVEVTSCDFAGRTAKVGLTVHNSGTTARSAQVAIEFRDAAGTRIDTASATAREVAPGDTVTLEESTLLDVPTESGTCHVATVR